MSGTESNQGNGVKMVFNTVERVLVSNTVRIPHLGKEMPLRAVYRHNRGVVEIKGEKE